MSIAIIKTKLAVTFLPFSVKLSHMCLTSPPPFILINLMGFFHFFCAWLLIKCLRYSTLYNFYYITKYKEINFIHKYVAFHFQTAGSDKDNRSCIDNHPQLNFCMHTSTVEPLTVDTSELRTHFILWTLA